MDTTQQPLFVFLHGLDGVQTGTLPSATAAAVAFDVDNRQPSVFASGQGIGVRHAQSLHTAALFVGATCAGGLSQSPLLHGMQLRPVVNAWLDTLENVLGCLGGLGRDGFQLDTHTSFFMENDVFPEDTLHASDPGFWTPDARTHRAGILHTRDAAIWTGNSHAGFAPSICPQDYADRIQPDADTRTALALAAQAAGVD